MKLSLSQQHPLADETALQTLQNWREHAHAPRWNLECGDRLDTIRLNRVRQFSQRLNTLPNTAHPNEAPDWAREFTGFCAREVPFYRAHLEHLPEEDSWPHIPFCTRADLAREVWHFVPDGRELLDMIVYWTSGTMGSQVHLPAPFEWASLYLPWFERALQLRGVLWPHEPNRVALMTVAAQEHTLTYVAPSAYLNGAATMKINLHPAQWRNPNDAISFLHAANPQVIAGDPVSLQVLADTDFAGKPLALLSSALQLAPKVRAQLENRFGCPVIDIYSSNETGPIACSSDGENWHLPDTDLFLEIVRPDGTACSQGEAGETVVTTARNNFLPLLRYRTGDFAAWHQSDGAPILRDFHGREPVMFQTSNDTEIHSLDVTHALHRLFLSEFSLHQSADFGLHFRFRGGADESEIRAALQPLFPDTPLQIEQLKGWPQNNCKLVRYSSDLMP